MPADFARLKDALATRYGLIRELGSGGMATVYLAEDLRHHRNVAVKVLRPELAASLGSERFFREIETAARLQHPHILPLLDSGEADGYYYYVMPYVQGESLRERIDKHGELPIPEALRILREVVDALAEAHSNGVVHRDIKPDNVMLSGRHALVTDFGIAKAVSEATGPQQLTTAGVALGTPAYMAPEQATADPTLDHRVDIYAVGILGYEMLTGFPPFTGRTAQEILAAQVTQAPEPVTLRRAAVSGPLAEALMKCLEKHAADRWQTASALLEQLEVLSTPSGGVTPAQTRPVEVAQRQRFPRWLGWALGAAVVVVVLAVALRPRPPHILSLGSRTVVEASPEWDIHPTFSPDGKMLSYTSVGSGSPRLVVQQTDGGNRVEVSTSGFGGVFSPDGTRLLVLTPQGLEVMPVLGGQSRVVAATNAWGSWSPDGGRIVFPRGDTLYVQPVDSARATPIANGRDIHSPAWSSDGKLVAYVEGNSVFHRTGNLGASGIRVVPASGGTPVPVITAHALNTSPVWVPGRRTLLFISDQEGGRDIYQVELTARGAPRGPAVRITTGLDAEWISLSADGHRLAWSQFREYSNIWSLAIASDSSPMSRAVQVTTGNQNVENLAVSPDGEWLYFDAERGGNSDLYRQRVGGGPVERLTTDPAADFCPAVSPDGRELAFHSMRTGNRDVFVMPSAGGEAVQITRNGEQDYNPSWSRDGRRLVFDQQKNLQRGLWLVDRGTTGAWGDPAAFPVTGRAARPRWSPDGRWVSYITPDGVAVLEVGSGQSRLIAPMKDEAFPSTWSSWAEDSRTIYLAQSDSLGVFRVVSIPLSGAAIATVAYADVPGRQFHRHGIAVSRGRLFFPLVERNSDVWVAEVR